MSRKPESPLPNVVVTRPIHVQVDAELFERIHRKLAKEAKSGKKATLKNLVTALLRGYVGEER